MMKTKAETKHELLLAVESWYLGNTRWDELDAKIDSLLDEYLEWEKSWCRTKISEIND